MSAVFIGAFILIAIISRIREAMKEGRQDLNNRLSGDPGQPEAPQSFSLQQVLAEIEKVKAQSEGSAGGMQPGAVRDQIRQAALTQQRKHDLAERAERKRRETAATRSAESVRPLVRTSAAVPQPEVQDAQPDAAPMRSVADSPAIQATASAPGSSTPQPRPSAAQMRGAIVWREILSLPVSLRDEETL